MITSFEKEGLSSTADHFDVKILNDAPFTFLKRVLKKEHF